ncbi:MogA/MoaB family molybdenum cofactor biosynthesis protein [Paeniglutamicibacter sp. ABSL32-1]|uniref:MogA/MoaB family molybdenum cofactor biosynthesis protein n=1 Tax=Paeniglutamicibacter quisquiliarum TaxID=2849498 RepID=UPI001C2D7960|nr:MogA/MoaB family molybdenum cofactor biosynthesis protein [Paeniglutamicibacter quisquiliarum]MBV1780824.1 MogA/MoaB family molybdenum cofactor biosynthesis protein [Paeniglutamicibacter quisquiliarum]
MSACEPLGEPRKAAILISSTRAALGIYEDASAPVIADWLQEHNFDVIPAIIVPDGPSVGAALQGLLLSKPRVIITSGGTGLSPDDMTPEETEPLLNRMVPGIMEALRAEGRAKTPMAALSRGYAGISGETFIVNLPGSPSGVMDGLTVLTPLLTHICEQLEGGHVH